MSFHPNPDCCGIIFIYMRFQWKLLDRQDLIRVSEEVERENVLFAKRALLDSLTLPSQIMGREDKAKELLQFLLGYKQGLVVPFVSVFGRSGSGKSTIVKFVCENLGEEEVSYAFVNLRKAKTVFGCANLILAELDEPNLKSPQGMNLAIENIGNAIESLLFLKKKKKWKENKKNKKNKKKGESGSSGSVGGGNQQQLFVLVLDEFDVLFYDKRGKPSDFIYKLLVMEEKLREKGLLMCTIAISNNVIADYEIDDRVKSRIGTSEIFFEPYSRQDVLAILKDRTSKAFSQPIDSKVLEYCADRSSDEYGDARRAIDLLRVAAEIAGRRGEKTISKKHVDAALNRLQKDRVSTTLSSAPYHLKLAAAAIARITYLTEEVWHSTSTLYNQYCRIIAPVSDSNYDINPLTYRRVSELLTELENMGIVITHTGSKGRHGYGTQYKLVVPPELIGKVCFHPDWWNNLVYRKKGHDRDQDLQGNLSGQSDAITNRNSSRVRRKNNNNNTSLIGMIDSLVGDNWKQFVSSE